MPRQWVTCDDCHVEFRVDYRTVGQWRRDDRVPVCAWCRGRGRRKPITEEMRQELREYWLSRYSLEELRELALGLWPELDVEPHADAA